ncbi:MAG: ABC transporter ATP-binding protein [Pseudomonadota bacterium]
MSVVEEPTVEAPAADPATSVAVEPRPPSACDLRPWEDPAAKPLVRLERVTKRFGAFTAVNDLSFNIYSGEFFAILGPSGCGKTTVMRMLAGFETPSEGRLTLDGEDLAGTPPHLRPVNMMFQSYALFPHLSVEQNIAFGLKREGRDKAFIADRVVEMLQLVQLKQYAKRKPHQLSGGQRQRVALARALAKRPRLLLLDEPLGALDKKLRQETQFELVEIQERLGATFVIVTHDQEEAMTVASRIAVMDHGVLAQLAPPAELYEYPASRFVAEFIGEVNILPATAQNGLQGQVSLAWREGAPALWAQPPEGEPIERGREVFLALRPEKIEIAKAEGAPPADPALNAVEGEVIDIAYLGNISTFHVRLEGGALMRAQTANRLRVARREITWGDRVRLCWSPDAGVVLTR